MVVLHLPSERPISLAFQRKRGTTILHNAERSINVMLLVEREQIQIMYAWCVCVVFRYPVWRVLKYNLSGGGGGGGCDSFHGRKFAWRSAAPAPSPRTHLQTMSETAYASAYLYAYDICFRIHSIAGRCYANASPLSVFTQIEYKNVSTLWYRLPFVCGERPTLDSPLVSPTWFGARYVKRNQLSWNLEIQTLAWVMI